MDDGSSSKSKTIKRAAIHAVTIEINFYDLID